ncbi:MAG: hypothetical protein K2N03_04220 [Muribaculaceae bacterium]|nr:hypothetical protein [Muribaculaceae bacterium]
MKKNFLAYAIAATAILLPGSIMAQEEETPDIDLTIGCAVTSPSSVAFNVAPTEFTLDFNNSGIKVLSITDNTVLPSESEPEGCYAYVEYVLNDVTAKSAPLSISTNEGVVTLTADYASTPDFNALLNSPGYYSLNLVIPYKLFTVKGINIVNKTNEYFSLALTNTFIHAGDAKLVDITSNPASGSQIERASAFEFTLSVPAEVAGNGHWVNIVNVEPSVFTRLEGETSWIQNGRAVLSIDATDPTKAKMNVRPAMSGKGQYRFDIPVGAFSMTKYADETSSEVEASYISSATSLRFAIGEEVETGGLSKETIIGMVTPAEGDVNLTNYPSGVEYLQICFNEIPTLNRTIGENIKMYYNGGEKPLREVNPLNEMILRLQTQGVNNDFGHILNIWFDYGESNFDAPGDYTVEFPAGLFLFGEMQEPNAAFSLNFHINKTLTFSIYPKNASAVDDIETITLNFNTASSVTLAEDAEKKINIASLSTQPQYPKIDIDGKIVRLTFDKITESHVYTLTIPAGVFNAVIDDEILPNQPMEFIYTVSLLPIPEVIPAEGVLPSNTLYDITLDLGEDAEITSYIDNGYNRLLRVGDDGEIIYAPVVSYYKYEEPLNALGSNIITLIPKNETPLTLSPGNYVLVTTRYLYTLKGGDTAGEYFYYFTVLPDLPAIPKPEITPWEEVQSASHFTLTLPDNEIISALSEGVSYLYPKNEDGTLGEYAAKYFVSRGEKSNMVDLVSVATEDVKPGIYQLSTPKALFRTSTAVADAYDFDIYFGMSSVISASAENETFNVYTLNGIRVLSNASADALENLTTGFYIINGKKVIVK